MQKSIRVGVAGCGYWGPNLVRNLHQTPECSLKLICDANPARLAHMRGLYPEVEACPDYGTMVNGADLDAILIATPVSLHYSMARASLLAGKHTFIEKPMAMTVAECEELNALAERQGLVLMVGHTFLFSPSVRKIKEIIGNGEIGELHYVAARRLNLGLFQKEINVAWDLAPHDLSIILFIMDELPTGVACWGAAHITPGIEDITNIFLTFAKNRSATVHSSWLDPKKVREITFVGSRRMIVYDDVEMQEKIRIYDARVERPAHYDTFAEFQYSYHHGNIHVPFVRQDEPLKLECQHFLECIREGRRPMTSGQHGLEVVRILEVASESLKQGGVRLNLPSQASSSAIPRPFPTSGPG